MVGREGSAKRVDVCAVALWNEMTVEEMTGLDLGYAPPFSPVWDPMLVAALKAAYLLRLPLGDGMVFRTLTGSPTSRCRPCTGRCPAVAADGLAELQVRWPAVALVFCETRPLAEEWTYRYLAAAHNWALTEPAALERIGITTGQLDAAP